MAERRESILNRGVEGRGIYAGSLSFFLTALAGGLGVAIGVSIGLVNDSEMGGWERVLMVVACGGGFGASMAGAAAVLGLVLGSHLARSFHWIFMTALVWIAAVGGLGTATAFRLPLGLTYDPLERHFAVAGAGAVVLGAGIGVVLGMGCEGFAHRARKLATVGAGVGVLLAGAGMAAMLVMNPPRRWDPDIVWPGLMLAAGVAGVTGMIGALIGADRRRGRGFAVMVGDGTANDQIPMTSQAPMTKEGSDHARQGT